MHVLQPLPVKKIADRTSASSTIREIVTGRRKCRTACTRAAGHSLRIVPEYIACLTNERTTFFTAGVIVEKKASAGAACRTVERPQSRPQNRHPHILTIAQQRANKPSLSQH